MSFVVVNGMFAFLFLKLPFCAQFFCYLRFGRINTKNTYEK